MTKPIFDPIPLNLMPDLSMSDITKRLFNNDFLSDVKFSFKDQVIKSHSFELKKRSVMFEKRFPQTINTLYPAFHEVIRFIYTDECEVVSPDRIAMLKLAIKYKIPGLETKLVNGLNGCENFDLFEYSVLGHYGLIYGMMREWIQNELHANFNCIKLETLHPEIVEEILNFDYIKNVTEDQLFDLLVRWMNRQCELHRIPMGNRRTVFDKFIRLIRFPTMTLDQFANCVKLDSDEFFTKQDVMSICRRITLGANSNEPNEWNSTPRLNKIETHRIIAPATNWKTKFHVLSNVIMRGLRFGFCNTQSNFTIRIFGKDMNTRATEMLTFKFDKSVCSDAELAINMGEKIKLKPHHEYTVEILMSDGEVKIPNLRDDRRPTLQDEFLNSTQSQIIRQVESKNLLEIICKRTEEVIE